MRSLASLRLQLLLASVGLLVLTAGLPRPAAAQENQQPTVGCEQTLVEANRNYTRGRFEAAVRLVRRCLQEADLSEEQTIGAYRLLGLAYLRQDSLDAAKKAIARLLAVAPQYAPDPVTDPPGYFSLVAIVREERGLTGDPASTAPPEEASWISQTWNWILVTAGAAVTTGLIVLLLTGGGSGGGGPGGDGPGPGGPGELPPPPPPPN